MINIIKSFSLVQQLSTKIHRACLKKSKLFTLVILISLVCLNLNFFRERKQNWCNLFLEKPCMIYKAFSGQTSKR